MENSRAFRELQCDVFLADCPARKVLALLAEKWTLLVIHALSERSYRTAELRRRIGGVSEKMLIQALRRLEECGLVARTSYPEHDAAAATRMVPRNARGTTEPARVRSGPVLISRARRAARPVRIKWRATDRVG